MESLIKNRPGGGGGWSVQPVIEIGAAGFEPTTPTTPKWCATKLRYAPAERNYHSAFPRLAWILRSKQPLSCSRFRLEYPQR